MAKVKVYEVSVDIKAHIKGHDVWKFATSGIIARGLTGLCRVMRKINTQYQCTDYMIRVKQREDL